MKILQATYGGADVTDIVSRKVKEGRLLVKADNSVFGDPAPGLRKVLEVVTDVEVNSVEEGQWLMLPVTYTDRLGVWYTNNNHEGTVRASLMNLSRFNGRADILTSVWNPIAGNPFPEFVSQYRVFSHLNIGLQVLNLLYVARQVGKYKWVSFLEHDVLYPADYFTHHIPATSKVAANMNYHGICSGGFQRRMANHHPLHQMTMDFDFAISHWEKFVLGCIKSGGGGVVEPDGVKVYEYETDAKALHVNHRMNFTSHYSIYSDATNDYDEDWGNAQEMINRLRL